MRLNDIKNTYIKELTELGKEIEKENYKTFEEFLDRILDIGRFQYIVGGKWETSYYQVCLSWGGPAVWIDTLYRIRILWSGESLTETIEDPDARKAIDYLYEYIEEIYGGE